MNDRPVHPYRQPQEQPKPPGDPMRVVLYVAGGVAVLIAGAAIFVGASDRFATRTPPAETTHRFSEPYVLPPPMRDAQVPPGVDTSSVQAKTFPAGALSFVASAGACFGNCVTHTTRIDSNGRVTLAMDVLRGKVCAPADGPTLSAADLAALTEHARSIHMENMSESYIHMTDVQGLRTEVSNGRETISVAHLATEDAPDAAAWRHEAAAIEGLHEHIERLAGSAQWMKTCKRTEKRAEQRGHDLDTLLDTR